jgi:hypothetical protein
LQESWDSSAARGERAGYSTEGYMTAPQKYASVLTFAKRYALCNALGISTGDEDTNVTDVGKQADVKSIKSKILFLLRRLGHEAKSKADIEKAVEQRTQLKLVEQNYDEIVARLSSRLGKRGIRPITGGII